MPSEQSERPGVLRWALMALGVLAIGAATAYVLANREDPDSKPYLAFLGGGFMFNYRVADTFYGFTAKVIRPVPVGTVLEAQFEDPAGGQPIIVRERMGTEKQQYALRTPGVLGVKKDRPYKVIVRLLERDTDRVIWQTEKHYSSVIDQTVMPEGPLTIGPGYHRPPPPGAVPASATQPATAQ